MRWILLLLLLAVLVAPVLAQYHQDFQDDTSISSWVCDDIDGSPTYGRVTKWGVADEYWYRSTCPSSNQCGSYCLIEDWTGDAINYIGWTDGPHSGTSAEAGRFVDFCDSNWTTIDTVNVWDLAGCAQSVEHSVEILRASGNYYVYCNGTLVRTQAASATQPTNIKLRHEQDYTFAATSSFDIDDLVIAGAAPDQIGIIPSDWYLMKYILDGTLTGLYNGEGASVYAHAMHASYRVESDRPGFPSETYTVVMTNVLTGLTVNTTVLPTTALLSGNWTYNITSTFFENTSVPYGMYSVTLKKDSVVKDVHYFIYESEGAEVNWDTTQYFTGDTATIDWTITVFDLAVYDYALVIYDPYGTVVQSTAITSAISSLNTEIDDSYQYAGTYWAVVRATNKETGTQYWMSFDIAEVQATVGVEGFLYSVTNGTHIPGWMNISQLGVWHNLSVDSSGMFNYSNFVSSNPIYFYPAATGYWRSSFNFTPLSNGQYNLSTPMIPSDIYHKDNGIDGIVVANGVKYPISAATANIENATASATNTSTVYGYYGFNSLPAEAYTVWGTKTGFTDSPDYTVTASGTPAHQVIEMVGSYGLNVQVRDTNSLALITSSTSLEVQDTNGATVATGTTSTGSYNFTLPYGFYTVLASNSAYYADSSTHYLFENATEVMYLERIPSTSSNISLQYTPLEIRIGVHDRWGQPIEGINVTVSTAGSTMDLGWLNALFGISQVDLYNTTMFGTTDSGGTVMFVMFSEFKYTVSLDASDYGIGVLNATLYPSTSGMTYWYMVDIHPAPDLITDEVEWHLYNTTNATYVQLCFNWTDSGSDTTNLTFFLYNVSNGTVLRQFGDNSSDLQWDIRIASGQEFIYGFYTSRPDGQNLSVMYGIDFPYNLASTWLGDLKGTYGIWIAIGLMTLTLLALGSIADTPGLPAIFLVFEFGFFVYLGFLDMGARGWGLFLTLLGLATLRYWVSSEKEGSL